MQARESMGKRELRGVDSECACGPEERETERARERQREKERERKRERERERETGRERASTRGKGPEERECARGL